MHVARATLSFNADNIPLNEMYVSLHMPDCWFVLQCQKTGLPSWKPINNQFIKEKSTHLPFTILLHEEEVFSVQLEYYLT